MRLFRSLFIILAAMGIAVPLVITHLNAQGNTTTQPLVAWRTITVNRNAYGEVLINNSVVYQIRTSTSRYNPSQQAEIIAGRLQTQINRGYTWRDVKVNKQGNNSLLIMGNATILTITPVVARAYNTTPSALAEQWRANTVNALRGVPVNDDSSWPSWNETRTKIVPIVSLGTPGLRLGFAQVTGPSVRVDQVKSVVQIDAEFQRVARIHVFVPSSILAGMNRVQGVAVTALLQYSLIKL